MTVEYKTHREFEDRAEIYGTIKHLIGEYGSMYDVVVMSRYNHGRTQERTVNPEALEYVPEGDKLDIYGKPATGRFPSPKNVCGIKVIGRE